ncbi:MAG: carboxypeptidase regulatory-like domain-containing protein [Planctomycetes bacterium]|nr:carboxypeptidase regulatory-like domain-containing protein [Planctomycetota bacterium]
MPRQTRRLRVPACRQTVSYDPQRGLIDVLVRAKGRSQMPPGGSKVEWTAEEGMVGKMLLAGEVKSPDYTARLFAGVPSDPQRVVTVRLSADGFPRAFVFRVPCGAAQADVPVEEDLCQARIVSPSSGDVIRAPAATLPVALQVDMPVDAFQRAEDRIEVGIDVNLDRDLEGENTTVLRTDRQVQIRLNEAGPAGLLSLEAKVEDFQLDLDARGLQNARVGVLAKAVSSHTGWSPPVEVTLDGTAPRITSVDVSPAGLVTLGQPLKISMLAEDDEPSSGITRVELALDLNRTGEFDPEVKPVPAAAEPGGRWSAAIPTDKAPAGVHPLLIRAVDRAGPPSELSTVQVKIATTEDVKAQQLQATSRVTGIALHAGQPQPGMTVTLDDGKVPPVQTDDQGRFSFAAVPAGKHKVVAAGVIRNRTRRAEAEFTIEPATPQATALRLTLQ